MHKLAAIALTLSAAVAQDGKATTEYGTVTWMRDFDAALAAAKQHHKPVFLLFQEVPG